MTRQPAQHPSPPPSPPSSDASRSSSDAYRGLSRRSLFAWIGTLLALPVVSKLLPSNPQTTDVTFAVELDPEGAPGRFTSVLQAGEFEVEVADGHDVRPFDCVVIDSDGKLRPVDFNSDRDNDRPTFRVVGATRDCERGVTMANVRVYPVRDALS